ncbi:DNA polymerase I [Anaerotignum neopropionicum]|uniref:DNA polymerase I n=1 Tax=Anaerotignum neopropionicum TaxID=36847 RepID=A0A136WE00_9FIRM|nr:DNA polymerase I [Anaerotignum neopropionicum]KXL52742.1 DNA polymerase I [Anaerotignum neopropionicum]
MTEKIMLIDGNSIVNRAFYGVPLLTNSAGQYTNGVYGFLNILFKLMDEEKPDYLAVAFDLHAPTFRHKEFGGYKGTRKGMPDELRTQMPLLKEMLQAMNIQTYEMEGYEADDILGTLSAKAEEQGVVPVVVSGDRDLLQLASETLKVRIPKTKGGRTETEDYYAKDVVEKYGVTPLEFIDVKALMGDASDNIPGVPGIGEKTAAKIIREYHDLENAIAHASEVKPKKAAENLAEFQAQARLSKFLATIIRDMPISLDKEGTKIGNMFNATAYDLVKRLELKSMFDRFEKDEVQTTQIQDFHGVYSFDEAKIFFQNLENKETAYIILMDESVCQGLALYQEDLGGVWLEVGEELTEEQFFALAKPFFSDDRFIKIGHDIKKDLKILGASIGEMPKISFDTAIGAYILNPTGSSYDYDDLAKTFLNQVFPSGEEVLGKGKSKKAFCILSEEERKNFAVTQAKVCFEAKKIMEKQLAENGQTELFYDIEMPLIYVLADMEEYGIKVDKEALLLYQKNLETSIDIITKEIFSLSGEEFNLNSPKQLGVILFEKLGLKGGKKTKTGYSTAADVLEKLKYEHPMVEKILYYRQLAKLKSTYADGLLAVMDEKTEKIYSTFNQTITATGRISSTEPNLQNIPVRLELGRELRKVFIPENREFCFLDADYSQIELRVLAHIAGDETLINAFRNNQDIHRLTASQVFHVPFDEVTSLQRSNAKAVNFGIVYGIGSFSLSQDLGISRKEAEQYIAAYFAKYPNIKKYLNETIQHATEEGYVSTLWNRRRAMPELQSNNFVQRSFGERVAMNMPIQGSAADIIKIAMVHVHKALKEGGYRSRLILQVHDELLIETYIEEREAVARILKENMEQAAELSVPLDVEVHEGNSWFEAK